MKVRAQIHLLVFVMLLTFGVAIIGLIHAFRIATTVDDLEFSTGVALKNVYRLTEMNKELLVNEQPISRLIPQWQATIATFGTLVHDLALHSGLRFVPHELRIAIERSSSVWELSETRFQNAVALLDQVLADESVHDFHKRGFLRFRQWLADSGGHPQLLVTVTDLIAELRSFDVTAKDLVIGNLELVTDRVSESADMIRTRTQIAVGLVVLVATVLSLLFAFSFTKRFTGRIRKIELAMSRVADRDITVRANATGKDEIAGLGTFLDRTLDGIAEFVRSVRKAVEKANELKDGLSSGSTESASALHEISSNINSIATEFNRLNTGIAQTSNSVADIDKKIKLLNENIATQTMAIDESAISVESISSSIQAVGRLAQDRRVASESLVKVILDGGDKIQATNSIISATTNDIENILEIITIINNVSDQTNLLSMNAAIESAHAGAAGKGFAVVAEEIRKLAESTSKNASQIDHLLKSITDKMRDALHASQVGAEMFDRISSDVTLFRSAMVEISENIDNVSQDSETVVATTKQISSIARSVNDSANDIAANAEQISTAMNEAGSMSSTISGGIREIDHGAKEVLTALTDISHLSDASRERMQTLSELVDTFRTDDQEVGGSQHASDEPQAVAGASTGL